MKIRDSLEIIKEGIEQHVVGLMGVYSRGYLHFLAGAQEHLKEEVWLRPPYGRDANYLLEYLDSTMDLLGIDQADRERFNFFVVDKVLEAEQDKTPGFRRGDKLVEVDLPTLMSLTRSFPDFLKEEREYELSRAGLLVTDRVTQTKYRQLQLFSYA